MASGPRGAVLEWAEFLHQAFPGWLLPASHRSAVSVEVAARFLERLSGRPDHLQLLRANSLFLARGPALSDFAHHQLPDLLRALPSRSEVERREWEGGFHGRLDIPTTQSLHRAGQISRFVTRSRRRSFDLPETILVAVVVRRLLAESTLLLEALGAARWLDPLRSAALRLRVLLETSHLRDVAAESIGGRHFQAAQQAHHGAYKCAMDWQRWIHDVLDERDPAAVSLHLAEAALLPLESSARFELAVLLRLLGTLHEWLSTEEPGRWRLEHALVLSGRREVAVLHRDDGLRIELYYNQAMPLGGPRETAMDWYFGVKGRQRPDISTRVVHPDGWERWTVVEVKLSEDEDYLRKGYDEALAYRHEYAPFLTGWPKAIIVTSAPLVRKADRQHEVVAVSWSDWVPARVVDGLLEGIVGQVVG